MATQTGCDCSQAKACEEVDLTPCSSGAHVSFRNRLERPLKYETDCGPKKCSIFGGHDAAPLPDYHCHQKLLNLKNENKNSLGSPIGLVASTVNMKTDSKTGNSMQARYATCLKAFARLHLNDEKDWNAALLDDLIKEGLDLQTTSQTRRPSSAIAMEASDIYMSHEQEVMRQFELCGFTFRIELMPKFQLKAARSSTELGATGDGFDLTLEHITAALRSFLRQHKYGLLKVGAFYALIWRSREAYFVFDGCGRRLADFRTDKENGVVMLMCFKSLANIRHLINNLSGLQITESLLIRQLKLVKVVTPAGEIMQRDYGLRNHQYEIVNDDYAYLRTDLHLTLNKRDLLRNRSALPVAVTAIVASKIDHPATWNRKMVDKIICFGVNFWQTFCMPYKTAETVDVSEFPATFILGQFHINVELTEHFCQGTWHCVPAFKHSQLANAVKKAFEAEHNKLILQINYQMYAIWKKQEFIYLLDPYRHRLMGRQDESKIYEQMEKSAGVRMFRGFEVFMSVLNQILLDSNRTSHFFVHAVKVKNIQPLPKEKPGQVRQVTEPQRDDYGEIISINEHICFEEAENVCKAALAEISDYEDDDLKSDVVEIELRTSSSEEELLEEEGEVGAGSGKVGEMEDIETSSSGEEGGGGHQKKAPSTKRRGKGHPTKQRKATKPQGGNNKTKEGAEEANDNEKSGDDSDNQKPDKYKKRKKSKKIAKKIQNETPNWKEETDEEIDLRQENKNSKRLKEKETPDPETDKFQQTTEMDTNKKKDEKKPKEFSQNKDASEIKDISGGKNPSTGDGDDLNTSTTKDKEPNPDKNQTLSKDNPLSQDNALSKSVIQQNDNVSKDQLQEDASKSAVQSENKSDFDKSKEANGKNEILKNDEKALKNKDKGEAKDAPKDNRVKERTEKPKEPDNEHEECLRKNTKLCSTIPNPNRYPGYSKYPVDMTVLGSESGRYDSICRLFQAGFKVADRLLLMTAWGNFVIFRCWGETNAPAKQYYLYDGCTCNFNRFRHFDLSVGTAGLICFEHLHNIIEYIRHLRPSRSNKKKPLSYSAEDICKEFCNKSFILRV